MLFIVFTKWFWKIYEYIISIFKKCYFSVFAVGNRVLHHVGPKPIITSRDRWRYSAIFNSYCKYHCDINVIQFILYQNNSKVTITNNKLLTTIVTTQSCIDLNNSQSGHSVKLALISYILRN